MEDRRKESEVGDGEKKQFCMYRKKNLLNICFSLPSASKWY